MIINITKRDLEDLVRSKIEDSLGDIQCLEVRSVGYFLETSDEDILIVAEVNMSTEKKAHCKLME